LLEKLKQNLCVSERDGDLKGYKMFS